MSLGLAFHCNPARRTGFPSTQPRLVVYSGAGIAVPQLFIGSTHMSPRISFGSSTTRSVGVTTATDYLGIGGNNGRLAIAQRIRLSGTTPPAPLSFGTLYVPINKTPNAVGDGSDNANFQVATEADPTTPIDITSIGSGVLAELLLDDKGMPPGLARGMDSSCPTWAQINTSEGFFDWSAMDYYLDYHCKQRGRQLLFCFRDTPTQYQSNAGTKPDWSVPNDLTKGGAFAAAMLTRYNLVSAFNPTGMKMIYGFEAWNEPAFDAAGAGTNFNGGTMADLAQFTRHVRTAALAVDPTVKIVGPGFTVGLAATAPTTSTSVKSLYNWLRASDGAGGAGKDHIDLLAWHGYDISDTTLDLVPQRIAMYRDYAQQAGLAANFPAIQTERGIGGTENGKSHPLLHARVQLVEMACGLTGSVIFQNEGYAMNPGNQPGLADAFNLIYNTVPGKTLTYCAIEQNNSVTVTANGVTINI